MAEPRKRGRPRELPIHENLNVRLPIVQFEWLQKRARQSRLDVSKEVRALIASAMKAEGALAYG